MVSIRTGILLFYDTSGGYMDKICDVCRTRPATHTIRTIRNGKQVVQQLCDYDYERLVGSRQFISPFESLFGEMGKNIDLQSPDNFEETSSQMGYPLSRHREGFDIDNVISDHAKEIIQQSGQTAVNFGRDQVDTEHLLYALTQSDVVSEVLRQFKIKPQELRSHIDEVSPKGESSPTGEIELDVSPRVKNVLEQSFYISQELGHGYIGPEHLLIGLAQEGEGLAGEVLKQYGLTAPSLRQQVVKVVGKGAMEGKVERKTSTPQLDKYSRDLSRFAEEGKLDPVIGRADEIETTIEILSRRTKNNPVLIGEPGVGKTAIVEGLAQRIASGEVPEVLADKRVVELSVNSMIAGSKYRGEFEERIKAVLDEITEHKDELVVFVDEIHTIVGAGASGGEGGLDVANVIKPYLARGELHLIGATTLNEYQKYIEKDAALERRFQPVFVAEPTTQQATEILHGLRDKYEAHHKVKISDEAIVAAVELSTRYISNRFLPDKAIDLIDQAASRVRILSTSKAPLVRELEDKINRLRREYEALRNSKKFTEAKRVDTKIKKLEENREYEEAKWRQKLGITTSEVNKEHIAQIVSKLTGIPITDLTEEERDRLLRMEEILHQRVVGQDEAIQAVSDAIRRSRAGLTTGNRPTASFLFLGPTGVGKTELAKTLAWLIFGDEDAITRIDMSEYMERFSVSRLVGSPPGYVGYEEGGQLTEAVRRRPYSVVLLDEIEKAHPDVYNLLLQVLDEGRLTDSKGRVVDFTNTIIIATSNLGSHLIQQNLTATREERKSYLQIKEMIMGLLKSHFRPEFLNRIDEIILFEALNEKQIKQIAQLQLEKVSQTARGQGIHLEFRDDVVAHIAEEGFVPEFGARELRRKIQTEIESPLSREMLQGEIKEGDDVVADYDQQNDQILFHDIRNEVKPKRRRKQR